MGSPPGDITASIWAEVAELVDPLSDDVREDIEQYLGEVADILERDAWGLAFYEDGDAQIFRKAGPAASSEWMYFLRHHQHQSRCVISHIRKATQGIRALRNTQPFGHQLHGFRHVFCQNVNSTRRS